MISKKVAKYMLKLLLSIVCCLFSFPSIASVEYNHGYIGKAQFNIQEKRFSLFDDQGNCKYQFSDIHFHPKDFVMHGDQLSKLYQDSSKNCISRVLLNSLPLMEHWSGDGKRPIYYTDGNSKLYWNSISDIPVFEEYRQLNPEQKAKFVFLINGFLHFDMSAIEAVKTTIKLYPDLPIVGFGEIFGEHDIMSDQMNPRSAINAKALEQVYNLAGKNNWFVIIHNNLADRSFKGPTEAIYQSVIEQVLKKHRKTSFILAHGGVMRNVVIINLEKILDKMLQKNNNLYIDISFVVLENYIMPDGKVSQSWVKLIEKYPSRFLFGTDDLGSYGNFYDVKKYVPLLDALRPGTAKQVAHGNFDALVKKAFVDR